MDSMHTFYQEQISKHKNQLSTLKKQLFTSSMLRFALFIVSVVAVYFLFGNTQLIIAIIVLTIALFIFLVSRHSDISYQKNKTLELIKINKTEIEVLNRKFDHVPTGDEFKDPNHEYSQDIDLFGKGSFFQYLNRTTLQQGTEKLAQILTANTVLNIVKKQNAIKELATKTEWRQEFSAIGKLVKIKVSHNAILSFLKTYTPLLPKSIKLLPSIFGILSIVLCILCYVGILSGPLLGGWLFIGISITSIYFKKIKKLSNNTGQMQSTFQQYQKLIVIIENSTFTADLLQEQKQNILNKSKKTSKTLDEFAKLLYALDQSNNLLLGLVLNGFFLWDIKQAFKIEQWIEQNATSVHKWFESIAFFDAYNSLANFSFNHPNYSYPIITNKNTSILKAKELSHPLLDPIKSIANDIDIDKEQFFIITGANMAGKSTFLRTVSLQIVLSNIGLPICAKNAIYNPIKLITSMRTTDSLTDDESYFFSELKRLRFVVDQLQNDTYFIVLDEILKGTNSTDKAVGSKKFVEKLVNSKSTGIIATHDLSLCELENTLPQIKNYYFDAEIKNNELSFDYQFKNGICQNMNASFLLKKMGIVD